MADQPTHELSPETEAKFRSAIADALMVKPDWSTVDAVMEQIHDLIVAVDVNADRRGYERGFGVVSDYKPGGPVQKPIEFDPTYLTVDIGGEQIVKVRL